MIRHSIALFCISLLVACSQKTLVDPPFIGEWQGFERQPDNTVNVVFTKETMSISPSSGDEPEIEKIAGYFMEIQAEKPSYVILIEGEDDALLAKYNANNHIQLYDGGKPKLLFDLKLKGDQVQEIAACSQDELPIIGKWDVFKDNEQIFMAEFQQDKIVMTRSNGQAKTLNVSYYHSIGEAVIRYAVVAEDKGDPLVITINQDGTLTAYEGDEKDKKYEMKPVK